MSSRRPLVALLAALAPRAERAEMRADLEAEHAARRAARGAWAAERWLWAQALRSIPSLVARSMWRGLTGFESRANAMQPGGPLMERWIIEARFALRRLLTRPAYTALAVLTLALGVGGMTAVFAIVRPILVDPLPYPRDRELGALWFGGSWYSSEFLLLRNDWPGFSGMAAYRPLDVTVEVPGGETRFVAASAVSSELFEVLGRRPQLGRAFLPGEDAPGAAGVVVVSDRFWRSVGADPGIVGRTLSLGGEPRTVVGVMPPGFWFPDPSVELWLADTLRPGEENGQYSLVGRAAFGRDVRELVPSLARAARTLGENFAYPSEWDKTKQPSLSPLREEWVGHLRAPLYATLAAMGVILLIACANVAALMLGQVESRSGELAVRTALGADRTRLTVQLLLEAVVLGLAGAGAGALLAVAGFDVLRRALPLGDWIAGARLDWTVFAGALGFALASSVLVALFPIVSLWRGDLRVVLSGQRTGGVVRARGGLQSALVIAEVALAVLLACGAGLLVRSVSKLGALDPGVDVARVAVVDVVLPASSDLQAKRAMLRDLVRELEALPGVAAAASTQRLPLRGPGYTAGVVIAGTPEDARPTAHFRLVSPEYFRTMGIPLRAGAGFTGRPPMRGPTERDVEREVVVNEAFLRAFLPGREAVGQMIGGVGGRDRIVGVAGDVAEQRLTEAMPPARYYRVDDLDWFLDAQTLVLRAAPSVDPASLLTEARRVVSRVAPSAAVREAGTMTRVVQRAIGPAREVRTLLSLLTALGLVLAAVGVYGVIAQFVGRRAHEWSIRAALGLTPARLAGQIAGHGARLVAAGVGAGLLGALAATRLLRTLLYGVSAADPATYAAVALGLLAVGIGATLVPAVRASRANHALVLRSE
jgi:predicted permease